jgi:hypothetical protein
MFLQPRLVTILSPSCHHSILLMHINTRKQPLLLWLLLVLLLVLPRVHWQASILSTGSTLVWMEPDVVLQYEDNVKPNGHKAKAKLDWVACKHTRRQAGDC